ncbi:hypothetical protein DEU56DRAFT_980757 [Suillus clintonianus]|uniref:uncharacterized protein n=1 Tax=Suillus clintonianus TaxID=1904413 RepID=UPI001B877B60|nr:uncharacterized protein DEU56DRAFT_980757 [Suillus clintonianus]KAG2137025.1 hypothetical protein DEU56DRAFT_980757 [Suillus clintonianus]
MQMEYSVDDVAGARRLQLSAYICTALVTFWTYDYIRSIHEEWTFLLMSRWTKVKGLYIIARYIPFLLITVDLCLTFVLNENPNKCQIISDIYASFGLISLTCSECFFILRTHALWSNNMIVLLAILSTHIAIIIACIGIRLATIGTSYVTISAIPGITGCYRSSGSFPFFVPFILFFVFALGLLSLTLVQVIQNWRMAKGPLHAILLKHSIFYYTCGLLLSAVNVLMPLLFSDSAYYFLLQESYIFIIAILATRMHLRLWHMDQHVDGSDGLVWISLFDIPPTP